jgi:hypothetical protein
LISGFLPCCVSMFSLGTSKILNPKVLKT